jgi:hypothetical protein
VLRPYTGGSPNTGAIYTTRFIYDDPSASSAHGDNAVLAFVGTESLTDRYLWGPAVDQLLADERFTPSGSNWMPTTSPGTTYWALGDNEGSVRDWITCGSLVDHVIYDSFGKIYSQSSTTVAFNFMHNAVFYDSATGLEYHSQVNFFDGSSYMAPFQRLIPEEREIVHQAVRAITDGPFIDEWEFHIRFGVDRSGFVALLARWPDVDDTLNDSDDALAINGALNEACNDDVISPAEWLKWFSAPLDEVCRIYDKWQGMRDSEWRNT